MAGDPETTDVLPDRPCFHCNGVGRVTRVSVEEVRSMDGATHPVPVSYSATCDRCGGTGQRDEGDPRPISHAAWYAERYQREVFGLPSDDEEHDVR